ncbi:hypothetical protein MKW92_003357 [Papaver armeniacum]|nr:hypothetical protein MKW92_003357 [Papaver armeniacum]
MTSFFINGSPMPTKFFVIVVFLMILFGFSSVTEGIGWYNFETSVIVKNALSPNVTLTYHCKSADDDLGERTLDFDASWHWTFHINFWETTLYWCNFSWDDNGKPRKEGYQIFKAKRDYDRCGYYCRNDIHSDGVYAFNRDDEPSLVYKWP